MSFFDAPLSEPDPPPVPLRQPDWMGPPEGWIGGFVPLRMELARTTERIITLDHVAAFPTGVEVSVLQMSRRPIDSRASGMGGVGAFAPGQALFGVGFADGSKWQSGTDPFFRDSDEPARPNLLFRGGGGCGHRYGMDWWLWPLPPAGPVTFAFAWPAIDIDERSVAIEGDVLRAAAQEAEQLWEPLSPEEHRAIMEERRRSSDPGIPPGVAFSSKILRSGPPADGGDETDPQFPPGLPGLATVEQQVPSENDRCLPLSGSCQ